MNFIERNFSKLVNRLSHPANRILDKYSNIPIELDEFEVALMKSMLESGKSMTNNPRLGGLIKACRYVVENNIPGDFVEVGVWRGANGIVAKKIFERLGSDKKVWMFDTFEGMTEPTSVDVNAKKQVLALHMFKQNQRATHNEWCYASLDEVRKNCIEANLDIESFKFIKGDVSKTLRQTENLPNEICLLRLDTDWYESTKVELEVLYPILSQYGVLMIDDYGHWEGARRAVDEYFSSTDYKPLFNAIDYTGRSAIKI